MDALKHKESGSQFGNMIQREEERKGRGGGQSYLKLYLITGVIQSCVLLDGAGVSDAQI